MQARLWSRILILIFYWRETGTLFRRHTKCCLVFYSNLLRRFEKIFLSTRQHKPNKRQHHCCALNLVIIFCQQNTRFWKKISDPGLYLSGSCNLFPQCATSKLSNIKDSTLILFLTSTKPFLEYLSPLIDSSQTSESRTNSSHGLRSRTIVVTRRHFKRWLNSQRTSEDGQSCWGCCLRLLAATSTQPYSVE